jgi:hypothetical protein
MKITRLGGQAYGAPARGGIEHLGRVRGGAWGDRDTYGGVG